MMNNDKSIITLREYIDKGKTFVIPHYQRGYVWGKSRRSKDGKEDKDSVDFIMESLLDGYKNDKRVFMQGVTVTETVDTIILIDGQQRTTFFYLLMMYLRMGFGRGMSYTIRKDSDTFLSDLKTKKSRQDILDSCVEGSNELHQDLFYFKKTIRSIDNKIGAYDEARLESFANYVLKNVCFLYIDIPEEKAVKVFKMMNGNRAKMDEEDVLKAEMLRMVSLDDEMSSDAEKREQDMLRSRYAREWDKWVYWWNRREVRKFYRMEGNLHPLHALLYVYYNKNRAKTDSFNFEDFQHTCLKDKTSTKQTFTELRHLQKRFEDTYNDVDKETHLHNTVGVVLCAIEKLYNPLAFLNDYFNGRINNLELFCIICMMNAGNGEGWLTYAKIKELANKANYQEDDDWQNAVDHFNLVIHSKDLYHYDRDAKSYKEFAFRQLMYLNVIQDNALGRAFNFDIDRERSIEHIHPKSKVYRIENGKYISAEDSKTEISQQCIGSREYIDEAELFRNNCSQHGIGNFALLYFNDNSKFSNQPFSEKKKILFDHNDEVDVFNSRELLHTIKLFAKDKWGVTEIKENKEQVITQLKKVYGIQ